MTKEEQIQSWIETSDRDFESMEIFFTTGVFHWSMYIGYVAIKKLLIAIAYKEKEFKSSLDAGLFELVESAGINLSGDIKERLEIFSGFDIPKMDVEAQNKFYNNSTHDFTIKQIYNISKVREWLLGNLK